MDGLAQVERGHIAMTPTTTQTVTVTDRNESKYLFTWGFVGTPEPRDKITLDFCFEVSEALFNARRGYALNGNVPVLSYIAASKHVDKMIHEHRQRGGDRL